MVKPKKLKVLVIFDFPIDAPDDKYEKYVEASDWRPNRNVLEALQALGHEVIPFGLHNKIYSLEKKIYEIKPDIVFNLLECFEGDRRHESHIAGMLELLKVPYTGCPPDSLAICRNKFYTKRILSPLKIKLPRSVVFPRGNLKVRLKKLRFPLFVKPLGLEGSDGISQSSFAENEESCLERVKFYHENLKTDALVEEYIEGRELYSSIIGNNRLKVLPLREMVFTEFPEDKPKFATFKAKWDKNFRKKWGIKNTFAGPLEEKVQKSIYSISRRVFRALGLKGVSRLDLRVTPDNVIYVIEVNPNPSLAMDDEVASSCKRVNISYPQLVQKLLVWGLEAHHEKQI